MYVLYGIYFLTITLYSVCLLFPFFCVVSLYFSFLHYPLKHKLKHYNQRQKQSWALALIPILSGDDCPSKQKPHSGGGSLNLAILLITLPSCLYLQLSASLTCLLSLLKTHHMSLHIRAQSLGFRLPEKQMFDSGSLLSTAFSDHSCRKDTSHPFLIILYCTQPKPTSSMLCIFTHKNSILPSRIQGPRTSILPH